MEFIKGGKEYSILNPISVKRFTPIKGLRDSILLEVGCRIIIIAVGRPLTRIKCTHYETIPKYRKELDRVEDEIFGVDTSLLLEAINSTLKVRVYITPFVC